MKAISFERISVYVVEMALVEDIERLSRVPLLEGFSVEHLRMLAFGAKRDHFLPGETLFRDGEVSDGGFFILSGQVDLVVDKGNIETILASYVENGLVGEMALITENKRVGTAIARNNVEVLYVRRELFLRLLEEFPDLAAELHQKISRSVQQLLNEFARVHRSLETMPTFAGSEADSAENEPESIKVESGNDGYMI